MILLVIEFCDIQLWIACAGPAGVGATVGAVDGAVDGAPDGVGASESPPAQLPARHSQLGRQLSSKLLISYQLPCKRQSCVGSNTSLQAIQDKPFVAVAWTAGLKQVRQSCKRQYYSTAIHSGYPDASDKDSSETLKQAMSAQCAHVKQKYSWVADTSNPYIRLMHQTPDAIVCL